MGTLVIRSAAPWAFVAHIGRCPPASTSGDQEPKHGASDCCKLLLHKRSRRPGRPGRRIARRAGGLLSRSTFLGSPAFPPARPQLCKNLLPFAPAFLL